MELKGKVIQNLEVDDADIVMAAYSLWKKSIGKQGYSLFGTVWKKNDDICRMNDLQADTNEILIALTFDKIINHIRYEL